MSAGASEGKTAGAGKADGAGKPSSSNAAPQQQAQAQAPVDWMKLGKFNVTVALLVWASFYELTDALFFLTTDYDVGDDHLMAGSFAVVALQHLTLLLTSIVFL